MCDAVASRLDGEFATTLGQIVCHLDSLGIDGSAALKAAFCNHPKLWDAIVPFHEELAGRDKARAAEYLRGFRGGYKHKTAMGERLMAMYAPVLKHLSTGA